MTKTLQINYDLHNPGRDYAKIKKYVNNSFSAYTKILASCWLVRTTKSPATVRNELNQIVDENDQVLVLDVTGDYWATNFTNKHTDWMHNNMGTLTRAA